MNFKKLAVSAAALMVLAGGASAASVNFAVNKDWSTSGHTYGVATVKGATVDTNGKILTTNEKVASWNGAGLGICSARYCTDGTSENSYWDQHTIDGKNKNEMALIDFGSLNVEVTSVTFNYWDGSDDFDSAVFANFSVNSSPTYFKDDISISGHGSMRTYSFASGTLIGSLFGFGADSSDDEFKLYSMEYKTVEPPVSNVPLPAGGLLLVTGLAGLAAARRRKA